MSEGDLAFDFGVTVFGMDWDPSVHINFQNGVNDFGKLIKDFVHSLPGLNICSVIS